MANTKRKTKKTRELEPFMPWQVDEFARYQDFTYLFPIPFLLLCKVWDITPHRLMTEFAYNLAASSWKREGKEGARNELMEYILECGYGQERYSPQELRPC